MPLFGPPNVHRLKTQGNARGLIKALGYEADEDVREAAAEALVELGTPAVRAIIAAMRGSVHPPRLDDDLRAAFAVILAGIGPPAVTPLVISLNDAAAALEKIHQATRGPMSFSHDICERYRDLFRTLALTLGQIGDQQAAEPLIGALRRGDSFVRGVVVEALVMMDTPVVVEQLVRVLQDTELQGRWAVAWALGQVGEVRGMESLVNALKDEDWSVRRAAAGALGHLGDGRAVRPLFLALGDWQQHRQEIVAALGQIFDTRSVNALIFSLNHKDMRVRLAAAKTLLRMYRSDRLGERDKQAILAQREAIKRLLRDLRLKNVS